MSLDVHCFAFVQIIKSILSKYIVFVNKWQRVNMYKLKTTFLCSFLDVTLIRTYPTDVQPDLPAKNLLTLAHKWCKII